MKKLSRETTLWLLEPSLLGVILAVFFWFVNRGRLRYRRSHCGPQLLWLVNMVNHWLGPIFEPISWPAVFKDSGGESLEYRYSAVVDECVDAWRRAQPGRIDADVSDSLDHYVCGSLKSMLVPVIAVAELLADSGQHNLYLVRWSLVAAMCKRHCSYYGPNLRLVPSFDSRLFFPLGVLAHVVIAWLVHRRPAANPDSRMATFIEYSPLNYPAFLGCWLPFFNIANVRVVFYSTPACRPNSQNLEAMARHGWEHIPLRQFAMAAGDILEILIVVTSNAFRRPFLLHHFIILFQYKYLFFKTLFVATQSRLLLQYQDYSWVQGAQRKAMAAAGGIMAGLHWSNIPLVDRSNYFTPQDIFFLWGRSHRHLLSLGGAGKRLALYSGTWIAERDESISKLSARGFVIVIFDSSADELLFQTPHALSLFHGVILDFLESTPMTTALLKPKCSTREHLAFLPGGKGLAARYEALESAKRVRWMPESTSPLDAAKLAHLCVCFGINSAGVLCSTHGRRSIHWDCAGYSRYFMYHHLGQQVVFPDLAAFGAVLQRAAAGDESVGDFSPFLDAVDPFRDGQAALRIGWFFTHYFELLQQGLDARSALDAAVAGYSEIWPDAVPGSEA